MKDPLIAPLSVADRPESADDCLFWQYPCITEKAAAVLHPQVHLRPDLKVSVGGSPLLPDVSEKTFPTSDRDAQAHLYAALPWATFIDKQQLADNAVTLLRQRIHSYRTALMLRNRTLRVHTVCQHIQWERLLPLWQATGITDVHLSHLPEDHAQNSQWNDIRLHPWTLYAVNVEDPQRREGLDVGRPMEQRSLLASFVGAHAPHYLSDVRRRLCDFSGRKGWHIRLTGERWHFEGVVYETQLKGGSSRGDVNASVVEYNRLLSDSQFALCPSGTGPNSLRLWEALAVGCVPVLLGVRPALPELPMLTLAGRSLSVKWDDIVVKVDDSALDRLPQRLESMPMAERSLRQRLGMAAWAALREQRCFQ